MASLALVINSSFGTISFSGNGTFVLIPPPKTTTVGMRFNSVGNSMYIPLAGLG